MTKKRSKAKVKNAYKAIIADRPVAGQTPPLGGDNPEITKVDGDAAVQAYIAAMPDWMHDVGLRLDVLIAKSVPGVSKTVKWDSPTYGLEGQGWFLSFHCFSNYVKVGFFRGTSLDPLPPGASKQTEVRYFDIHANDTLNEPAMAAWIRQAAALPGKIA
ncbi:DUF1801 domain-containing protein [Rhizobium sp. RAF56]|jgi:hypothetical protein|uniref:DUF1801 domain-containing protein n=1 Tax=Rhizobium sp. RAF56 TaxID=3233062 RepID=UPI003F99B26F